MLKRKKDKYILSIDSGGQGIRCLLFNKLGEIVQKEYHATPAYHPSVGAEEFDPIMLRDAMFEVIKRILESQRLKAKDIEAMGISNQRASFVLWEKDTGKPVSNMISWADIRCVKSVDKINNNKKFVALKYFAKAVSRFTKNKMLTATSILKFTTDHVPCRLDWYLSLNPEIREKAEKGEILFGTLDTWFIYCLTKGEKHLTDVSNAVATSLFNPFKLKWNRIFLNIFDIPKNIFPKVIDTNGDFGKIHKDFFGAEIPIRCVIGDQMAALFGHCCFCPGEVKISQGSGAFVDMNVGNKPKLSSKGLLPLIAWSIDGVPTYMLEGFVATAGTFISWLGSEMGTLAAGYELNKYAEECEDSDGVICIPTPSGIRYPYFNSEMRATILGISLSTQKRHLARAALEGIAFRLVDIVSGMEKDTRQKITRIKVDGGLSKSNVLLESTANFTNLRVERSTEPDQSCVGAAYMAGLATGYWESKEELIKLQKGYEIFEPQISKAQRKEKLKQWNTALKATMKISG